MVKNIRIEAFDYPLPPEKIALFPLANRDQSKLLIYQNGTITTSTYQHIASHIPANSMMVFNNTKVVEARLRFQKSTGSEIEIFCLEPSDVYADIMLAMQQTATVEWKCLVGGAKKWKEEILSLSIRTNKEALVVKAKKLKKEGDTFLIQFEWNVAELSFAEVLHLAGSIPLPPYINRKTEETDKERYQTIYAKEDGSVAAPTAGLHFTDNIFSALQANHIQLQYVTLHVGAGTFKPVKSETLSDHIMHAEFICVNIGLLEKLLQTTEATIAVGTTSLRTLETLYWMGVKITELSKKQQANTIEIEEISIQQWDAYNLPQQIAKTEALEALRKWMEVKKMNQLICKTQLLIAPGYDIRMVEAIVTNFHQPKSTLLLLVAAFIGDDWRKVYNYALSNNFRFLSYGDGSLIWKK